MVDKQRIVDKKTAHGASPPRLPDLLKVRAGPGSAAPIAAMDLPTCNRSQFPSCSRSRNPHPVYDPLPFAPRSSKPILGTRLRFRWFRWICTNRRKAMPWRLPLWCRESQRPSSAGFRSWVSWPCRSVSWGFSWGWVGCSSPLSGDGRAWRPRSPGPGSASEQSSCRLPSLGPPPRRFWIR